MANFAGTTYDNPILATPNGVVAGITANTFIGQSLSVSRTSDELAGAVSAFAVIAVAHSNFSGTLRNMFGGELFEKVIVIPRVTALGFVLSATQFAVEVWNAFRNSSQKLTSISITGVGGVSIDDPYGLPLVFHPDDSRIYQATMPGAGPAAIDQQIIFGFLSGILGADVEITGSRIVVFSSPPDWGNGVKETIVYLTSVLSAYNDNEQRRGLRRRPRRGLEIRSTALTAREAAGMESLVWGWQHQPYGVPWWQDQTPLTDDVAAGSFNIPCDTTDRQFAAGGLVVILADMFTFEALTIAAVHADSVDVLSPLQFNWTAGPGVKVMPVFQARISNDVQIDRLWSGADSIDCTFVGEAGQLAPEPSIALTTYKGFDVLEIAPNWASQLQRRYQRSVVTLDPSIGPISAVDKGGSPIVSHPFPWYLDSHAKITQFRAFILRRLGRLVGFWMPTWDQDLVLHDNAISTDTSIKVASEFYTRFFFPNLSRRYIALIPTDGSGNVYRKVTAAVDNGDGTESLVVDSALGKDFAVATTMISFLTFSRLADDQVEIDWLTCDLAQATISIQELPREVPA